MLAKNVAALTSVLTDHQLTVVNCDDGTGPPNPPIDTIVLDASGALTPTVNAAGTAITAQAFLDVIASWPGQVYINNAGTLYEIDAIAYAAATNEITLTQGAAV